MLSSPSGLDFPFPPLFLQWHIHGFLLLWAITSQLQHRTHYTKKKCNRNVICFQLCHCMTWDESNTPCPSYLVLTTRHSHSLPHEGSIDICETKRQKHFKTYCVAILRLLAIFKCSQSRSTGYFWSIVELCLRQKAAGEELEGEQHPRAQPLALCIGSCAQQQLQSASSPVSSQRQRDCARSKPMLRHNSRGEQQGCKGWDPMDSPGANGNVHVAAPRGHRQWGERRTQQSRPTETATGTTVLFGAPESG